MSNFYEVTDGAGKLIAHVEAKTSQGARKFASSTIKVRKLTAREGIDITARGLPIFDAGNGNVVNVAPAASAE